MLEIKLPWPHKSLFPNAKGGRHWGTFQSQKATARRDGFALIKAALGTRKPVCEETELLRITFYMPDRRRRDVDGIAKALGVDDSIFRPVVIDVDLDPAKRGFVMVEVGHD